MVCESGSLNAVPVHTRCACLSAYAISSGRHFPAGGGAVIHIPPPQRRETHIDIPVAVP